MKIALLLGKSNAVPESIWSEACVITQKRLNLKKKKKKDQLNIVEMLWLLPLLPIYSNIQHIASHRSRSKEKVKQHWIDLLCMFGGKKKKRKKSFTYQNGLFWLTTHQGA